VRLAIEFVIANHSQIISFSFLAGIPMISLRRLFPSSALLATTLLVSALGMNAQATTPAQNPPKAKKEEALVVYTARKEELIKPLFDEFTRTTGIPITYLNDEAPKLIARLESEGANTKADLLLTTDIANTILAKEKGVVQAVESATLEAQIPEKFRDKEGYWYGLSKRARAIFYRKDAMKPAEVPTYESLGDAKWRNELLVRSSSHPYNLSLVAAMLHRHGDAATQKWAEGVAQNLARSPQGGDSDQLKALAAGEGKLALANTYYYGRMVVSPLPEEREAAQKIGVIFPNQKAGKGEMTGAHVNISAASVTAHADQKANAIKLMEYLSSSTAQKIYAEANQEYPVNPAVKASDTLQALGAFREDDTSFSDLAKLHRKAAMVTDLAGWR
jgi:iron(III) transport system substrate-binding protein